MHSKVIFFDHYPAFGISIDAKGTIQDIHKYVSMYGGQLAVYDMSKHYPADYAEKSYRLSYRLNKAPFDFFIYGIELTEDEYVTQILAWHGEDLVEVEPDAEITLIDNSYFLIRTNLYVK